MAAGELLAGVLLAACGGALIALAMVTQRYALTFAPRERVPFKFGLLNRNLVWFIGLVIYGAGNGLYALAQLFGPLSLLAGVFTTLLIWNMVFARVFLKEELTAPRICGAFMIIVGVILTMVATPGNVKTEFTPEEIEDLRTRFVGAMYLSVLFASVLASVAAIFWFEAKYPVSTEKPAPVDAAEKSQEAATGEQEKATLDLVAVLQPEQGADHEGLDANEEPPELSPVKIVSAEERATEVISSSRAAQSTPAVPPPWLDSIMGLVYPGSMGIVEGIAHLAMKATASMLETCSAANQCGSPPVYIFAVLWAVAGGAALLWLRPVFRRYETTMALPVEYGTVSAVSACSGLLFFQEASVMLDWQVALMSVGLAFVLGGVACGRVRAHHAVTSKVLDAATPVLQLAPRRPPSA